MLRCRAFYNPASIILGWRCFQEQLVVMEKVIASQRCGVKQLKIMKKLLSLKVYPGVLIALLLGLFVLGTQFRVETESASPDASFLKKTKPSVLLNSEGVEKLKTSALSNSIRVSPPTVIPPAVVTDLQGVLRVSNQTDYPVRLAFLAATAPTKFSSVPGLSSPSSRPYSVQPAHWDFAPGEGGSQGLIVSLPNGNFQLKKGDILVAFAQDGSRQYWGPYVVGETPLPVWNSQVSEWQLVLQ